MTLNSRDKPRLFILRWPQFITRWLKRQPLRPLPRRSTAQPRFSEPTPLYTCSTQMRNSLKFTLFMIAPAGIYAERSVLRVLLAPTTRLVNFGPLFKRRRFCGIETDLHANAIGWPRSSWPWTAQPLKSRIRCILHGTETPPGHVRSNTKTICVHEDSHRLNASRCRLFFGILNVHVRV